MAAGREGAFIVGKGFMVFLLRALAQQASHYIMFAATTVDREATIVIIRNR